MRQPQTEYYKMSKQNLKALIPSQVRITRTLSYEVLFVDTFIDPHQVGECRHQEKQIVIKNGQSDTEFYKTYLHELFHAMSFEYPAMNLTEKQVRLLEEAFYRYERLNKII